MLMRVRLQAVCTPHVQTGLSTEEEEGAALYVYQDRMRLVRQLMTLPLYFQPLSVHIEPHGVVVMVPAHTEFVSCECGGEKGGVRQLLENGHRMHK